MREVFAFVRQDVLTNTSYRVRSFFSLAGLVVSLVPLYFIARALQPTMARSIATQGGEYFGFLLLGVLSYRWTIAAVNALPTAIASAARSGTLESLFVTPIALRTLVAGMVGYKFLWTVLESVVTVIAGLVLGAQLAGASVPTALVILFLIALTYSAFGVVGAALILLFRTSGPLPTVVLVGSSFLGGVYYPTHVIPSWLQNVSAVIPLTYGLRALRQTLLEGMPLRSVSADVGILALFAAGLFGGSVYALHLAVRHARRTGTLAQY
jgi:ABC-2 type transport system permease protein